MLSRGPLGGRSLRQKANRFDRSTNSELSGEWKGADFRILVRFRIGTALLLTHSKSGRIAAIRKRAATVVCVFEMPGSIWMVVAAL
jgi:hypothetical protein